MEWPGDARTIENWLRTRMLAEAAAEEGLRIDGLSRVRFAVRSAGPDIDDLLIDATGVRLTLHASAPPTSAPPTPAEPVIVTRREGMLRAGRLLADPVKVQGFPVHLDVTVNDLPIAWVAYDSERTPGDPSSRHGIESDGDASPTGSLSASMRSDDIGPLLTKVMRPLLSAGGVRLRRLAVTVQEAGPERLVARAAVSVRWKIFAARARAEVAVHIDPDAVITVERLRVSTRNPVIALGLRMVRGELKAVEGRSHDLNAEAGTVRVYDLRFTLTDRLAVSARLG